jgi:hypothetical protein
VDFLEQPRCGRRHTEHSHTGEFWRRLLGKRTVHLDHVGGVLGAPSGQPARHHGPMGMCPRSANSRRDSLPGRSGEQTVYCDGNGKLSTGILQATSSGELAIHPVWLLPLRRTSTHNPLGLRATGTRRAPSDKYVMIG